MINVSIIIPNYNNMEKLERLLKSIGIHNDMEIIVVDDKSNSDLEKFSYLQKKYHTLVKFIDNKTSKKGAGVCRNIGLEYANGRWLLFADSDDYFCENYYQIISEYFNSQADIVYFAPVSSNEKNGKISDRHIPYERYVKEWDVNNKESDVKIRNHFSVPWSKLIKRNLCNQYGIKFDEVMYGNDEMFSKKTGFYAKKIAVDRRNIYCVVKHTTGLTQVFTEESWMIRLGVNCDIYSFAKMNYSKEEFFFSSIWAIPLLSIMTAIRKGYSVRKVLNIFKKYNISWLDLNVTKNAFLYFCKKINIF